MIRFCKTCLNPSTRPNIKFDKKGNCYVCVYRSLKNQILSIKNMNGQKKIEIKSIKEWAKK